MLCRSTERHALRVVAGRTGDNALFLFLIGKLTYLVIGTPDLKRTRNLKILGL